jgi:hypothetical protein
VTRIYMSPSPDLQRRRTVRDIAHLYLSGSSRRPQRSGQEAGRPVTLLVISAGRLATRPSHVANLALALLETGGSVLCWDLDPVHPNLAYFLGLGPEDVFRSPARKGAPRRVAAASGLEVLVDGGVAPCESCVRSGELLLVNLPAPDGGGETAFLRAWLEARGRSADLLLLMRRGPAPKEDPLPGALVPSLGDPPVLVLPILTPGASPPVVRDGPAAEARSGIMEGLPDGLAVEPGLPVMRRDPRGRAAGAYRGLAQQVLLFVSSARAERRVAS